MKKNMEHQAVPVKVQPDPKKAEKHSEEKKHLFNISIPLTLKNRRRLQCLIGSAAGLTAWPLIEAFINLQPSFPSYLFFSGAAGAIFGAIFGAVFGSGDGITRGLPHRIRSGALQGTLYGLPAGIAGYLTGQGFLFLSGELFVHGSGYATLGLPLSRALGWGVLGSLLGAADGIRTRSKIKIKSGLAGGLAGGFSGGLLLEYLQFFIPSLMLGRLLGLLAFGTLLGWWFSLAEHRLSAGTLRLLNGKDKGREFPLNLHRLLLGSGSNCDIRLEGYDRVQSRHAHLLIKEEKSGYTLTLQSIDPLQAPTINDLQKSSHRLCHNDVVRIGSAALLYRDAGKPAH